MPNFAHFDWSPVELYEPIWIGVGLCVCLEGIPHPKDAVVIKLRPSTVFGTGGHPATRAVLNHLVHMEIKDRRVVDFKCGTGLLGIFCAFFGAAHVVHLDDDSKAVEETVENGMLNDCVIAIANLTRETSSRGKCGSHTRLEPSDILVTSQGSLALLQSDIGLIHELLDSGGRVLWGGHSPREHRAVENLMGEFFVVETVDDELRWPVIIARKK